MNDDKSSSSRFKLMMNAFIDYRVDAQGIEESSAIKGSQEK
jgi:hypothetical protein